MTETPLIIIELSPRQHIGYTVKGGHDDIIREFRQEILEALRTLAERLEKGEYPFHLDAVAG